MKISMKLDLNPRLLNEVRLTRNAFRIRRKVENGSVLSLVSQIFFPWYPAGYAEGIWEDALYIRSYAI